MQSLCVFVCGYESRNFSDIAIGTVCLGDIKQMELEMRAGTCAGSSSAFPTAGCPSETLEKSQITREFSIIFSFLGTL